MRVLLFGATGWAGGGVLKGCLADERVLEVRCVVRRPIPVPDKRMRVFEHADFLDYRPLREAFSGVDCCLYCLGVSSMQVNAEEYE